MVKGLNKDELFGYFLGTGSALFGVIVGALFFSLILPEKKIVTCPEVRLYSQGFLKRAAHELETLPEDSAVAKLLEDYKNIRDEMRKCSS